MAILSLWAMALGPAKAEFLERDARFPLDPPLALPQQLNGIVRGSTSVTESGRIDRIAGVFRAVRACWRPPASGDGPTGMELTVRLSFKRSGEVLGRPRITYYKAAGDKAFQDRFARSVLSAFERCTPLPLTTALGSAIAGRPFTFRFMDDRKT